MNLNVKHTRVFRDPLYGYVQVEDEVIKKLIDSQGFQRLRRIRQLSGVQMVFHGAEHSRFSHSLGVYELARRFSLIEEINNTFTDRERLLLLSSALLHDIGHGPYSHAFEDVFNVDHEKIGCRIILNNQEIRSILNTVDDEFAQDIVSILSKKHKFVLIEQLISSQLDVDRLDYLARDAYNTGVTYGSIDVDRLMRVLRIVDGKIVFKESGIHAIENYLISRYHMYWQVYYHPTSRAYEVILEKIYLRVKDLLKEGYQFKADISMLKRFMDNDQDDEAFLEIDDFYMNGLILSFKQANDLILSTLAKDFLNRNIWQYLDNNDKNIDKINIILNKMTKNEQKYFSVSKTVYETTYKDNPDILGENILILTDDLKLKTLKEKSKIIESLTHSGSKVDPKFFYRSER